ncbi:restriction endonuclease subunit S [Rhizobium laguerreae]|uniref:restriction endonuclease subunit S n=1 Tax=Rhizobium laguerreae TaxID=1076926 RepID=UPI001C911511|nr:restriction endonuclease subunit S [Rhizobium laguerreae]MBY3492564.1 hypothetical protein [Rhizobium laguerreae]
MNVHEPRLGAHFTSRRERGSDGLPTLSVTLDRGLVPRHTLERRTETNLSPEAHLRVREGDIAYNMMRMWQGASGLAEMDALVSPAYVVLAPRKSADPRFAAYLFKLPEMIHRFWAYSYGLTDDRLRLYFNDFKRIPWDLPSLPEQKKIAEILSTWDRAIETTTKLIANAEAQRRALMQELLTGKRRLKGFEGGEWRTVTIGRMGKVVGGGTPDSQVSEYWGGEIAWATPTDITRLRQRFIRSTERTITTSGLKNSSANILPPGSLLVCTRATVGDLAIAEVEMTTNQGFKSIIPSRAYDVEFLSYLFTFHKHEFVRYACGSTFLELSKRDFEKRSFSMPGEKAEQTAIAEVLNNASLMVECHQRKVETLCDEKRALMQQLLTGKRRVRL